MARSDDLHTAAFALTPLVLDKKYKHMRKPFEMILGGLIIPALVEDDPTVLDGHPEYKELLEKYSKEKVLNFFKTKLSPAPVVKAPEEVKVPEVKVSTPEPVVTPPAPKVVETPAVPKERVLVTGTPSEKFGGKYRRLKTSVAKERLFERFLECEDRDLFITWWNDHQRLVPEDDPICAKLVGALNAAWSSRKPLSPLQAAGYFSYLCRMGMWSSESRQIRIESSLKDKKFTIPPVFTSKILKDIEDNYNAEKADEALRKAAHAKLRAERVCVKASIPVEAVAKPTTPEPDTVTITLVSTPEVSAVEDWDIKFA